MGPWWSRSSCRHPELIQQKNNEANMWYMKDTERCFYVFDVVVGPLRFGRRTFRLSAERSTRLSYGPRCQVISNYQSWKAFLGKASQSDNTSNTRFTTYNFCSNIRDSACPKFYLQEAEPLCRQFYIRYWVYEECWQSKSTTWAGRSGEDRYLGMVEAAGSIPALSIVFRVSFSG